MISMILGSKLIWDILLLEWGNYSRKVETLKKIKNQKKSRIIKKDGDNGNALKNVFKKQNMRYTIIKFSYTISTVKTNKTENVSSCYRLVKS